MIEAPARDQIRNADDRERLTFVVRWTQHPDLTAARDALSRRERLEAATAAYSTLKQEVIGVLERTGQVQVHDLPGSGDAILIATTAEWRRLAPLLERREDVTVLSNRVVAVAP